MPPKSPVFTFSVSFSSLFYLDSSGVYFVPAFNGLQVINLQPNHACCHSSVSVQVNISYSLRRPSMIIKLVLPCLVLHPQQPNLILFERFWNQSPTGTLTYINCCIELAYNLGCANHVRYILCRIYQLYTTVQEETQIPILSSIK